VFRIDRNGEKERFKVEDFFSTITGSAYA